MFTKMKRVIAVVSVCAAVGVLAVIWQPAKKFMLQDSCLDSGGKWATNGDYCIHRQCAEDNSCKPSYGNNAICRTIKLGISKNELYFQLGMPENNKGNIYIFTGGGDESNIKAIIIDGTVSELRCGT
jgi:hypothetical protein